eukprot:2920372-Prymnesium_polylepis.1
MGTYSTMVMAHAITAHVCLCLASRTWSCVPEDGRFPSALRAASRDCAYGQQCGSPGALVGVLASATTDE